MLRHAFFLALVALFPLTASAYPIPCYEFGGDPAGCNAQPGCYWDTYGQICAQVFNPTPAPGPGVPLTFTSTCLSSGPLARCPVAGRIVSVLLAQQLSATPCLYGQTWSYDAGAVYVTNGCGGYFTVSYVPY